MTIELAWVTMRRRVLIGVASLPAALSALGAVARGARAATDLHAGWDALLKRHVAWNAAGVASTVSYQGFAAEREALKKVLTDYSAVTPAQYEAMKRDEKLAFLINAYNAFTVELILTRYPDLKSIKDLGTLTRSPWRKKFFTLLGEERNLDNVEHDMIRAAGAFDEPRIHFAVVCASIGCPALRPEAYSAAKLDTQLDDSVERFLRDRSRNRFDAKGGRLEVSKIFDWYRGDFEKGHQGFSSREQFFARYANALSEDPVEQALIKDGKYKISHLPYDWNLNDRGR